MRKRIRKSAQEVIGDVLRKVPLGGVGELRGGVDLRKVIISNVENLRESALQIFANEVSRVLSKIDTQHIVDQVLNNYTLRVEAKLELVPKNKGKKAKGQRGKA